MTTSIINLNGKRIHIVDTGCDITPRLHYVWLNQHGTDYACVVGGSQDEAHEAFADAIGYEALNNDEVSDLVKECLADCEGDEEAAWEAATECMLPLNGGAEWIDADEYGFWHPEKEMAQACQVAADVLRGLQS